jgi:hypothetical protein
MADLQENPEDPFKLIIIARDRVRLDDDILMLE